MRPWVVGTRRSELALRQTSWVIDRLRAAQPGLQVSVEKIMTEGDRLLHMTLAKVGGKGLFVKEIEQALLARRIDFAVHSMKDLPADMPAGLTIGAIPLRESPLDCLLAREEVSLEDLPAGAVVGTSSLRRQAQILACRPDVKVEPIRGNLGTRLQKMREGKFDAIVLALAGLARMGWKEKLPYDLLSQEQMLPAAGQGALAIQCREEDEDLLQLLHTINHEKTEKEVRAERTFFTAFHGGCHLPLAVLAEGRGEKITLTGLVAHPDGRKIIKDQMVGTEEGRLGSQLAQRLKEQGAEELLAEVRKGLAG
jgi:hydroxymethylbilane synthase